MTRRLAVAGLTLLLSLLGVQAVADTVQVSDRRDDSGAHSIKRLTVDNTGERIGATVLHRGARWTGRVRLTFDVAGSRLPEFVAVIDHAAPRRAVFKRRGGAPWRCGVRSATSRPRSDRTTLAADRRCFDMAPRMRVVATALSPRRRADSVASRVVLQQTRPNVVMILLDDMRADELRYMPATRRLIGARGVTFRNSFAPYPLCCPARSSMLTGKYTHNHGVYTVGRPWGFHGFEDSSTIATWLRSAGYATILVGKYLNGYGAMPPYGVEEGKSHLYVPPGWTEWRASIGEGSLPRTHWAYGGTHRYFDTTLSDNGNGYSDYTGKYQTKVYGNLSVEIIRRRAASNRPFFYYASYSAPHVGTPVEPDDPGAVTRDDGTTVRYPSPARPRALRGIFNDVIPAAPGRAWTDGSEMFDFTKKPEYVRSRIPINDAEWEVLRELARQRAEALYAVDQEVKRTIGALAATGELEETLIVFTSDNGFFLGEQRLPNGKTWHHDPALRVPLLMRGPGIPAGEDRYDPITSLDFAPTVAEFTGARPTSVIDGASLLRVARFGDRGWRRAILTETGPIGTRLRFTDMAGNEVPDDSPERDLRYAIGIRTDRFLLVDVAPRTRDTPGELELYDLAEDPHQYDNLAYDRQYADMLALLQAELQRLRACVGAECSAPMAEELWAAPGDSVARRRG